MFDHVGVVKVLSWEVTTSLCVLILLGLWMRQWLYWWIRGVNTYGLPPPIGCLLPLWTGRLSICGLAEEAIAKNPSSPLIGTWILMKPTLLVKDPTLLHQIMSVNFTTWPDRGFRDDPDLDPLSQHLVNLCGKRWKLIRSWMSPGFGPINLRARFDDIVRESDAMTRSMASSTGVNALDHTRKMSISVLTSVLIGLPESSPAVQAVLEEASEGTIWTTLRSVARLSCPGILTSIGFKQFTTVSERAFIKLVGEIYKSQDSESCDVLQNLIDAHKQYKTSVDQPVGDLNENIVSSNAFGALSAGYDTTSVTLAWGLLELATHPDVQDRLHTEIHKVLEVHGELNYSSLADMQYLDNVVSEILRLYPSVSLTARLSSSATSLGGFKVPAGLRVLIPIYAIHRDPSFFPNPHSFDPDRFTREDFQKAAYLPYGKGPRICIGWRLATLMIKTSIISLMKDFKISLSSETKQPLEMKCNTIFLDPKHPILLDLHPRT